MQSICMLNFVFLTDTWPRGPMDKASDFESEDCGFESHRGRVSFLFIFDLL